MNWRGALTENWGYKLAALVIVSLLWLSLTADERVAQPIATHLSYDVQDTAWVLVDAPDEVSTTFQGRNRDLLTLSFREPTIVVTIPRVPEPEMHVPLNASQVDFDRDLDVRPTAVVPSVVDLRFDRHSARKVPVAPDVEAQPAVGYTVLYPIASEPESVTVRGPASELDRISRIGTRLLRLEGLENSVLRDVPLEPPEGVPGLEIDPRSVLLSIPVDSLVMRSIRLPVRAAGPGARRVRLEPDTVEAVIRGAASAVQRRLLDLDHAVVEVPAGASRGTPLPVRSGVGADTTTGGLVSVGFSPAQVQVVGPEGG